jgi:hypothetical protein
LWSNDKSKAFPFLQIKARASPTLAHINLFPKRTHTTAVAPQLLATSGNSFLYYASAFSKALCMQLDKDSFKSSESFIPSMES